MLTTGYRWLLLHPLTRGGLFTLAVAGCCAVCFFTRPAVATDPATSAAVAAADPAPALETGTEWPRTVLRLWFLVPQLLPPTGR